MSKWVTTTLGTSCHIYQPKTISTKEMVKDGPYPVFGANGVIGRYDKFNHEEPQLLVTCRGATCGAVNVSDPCSWITGNAMVIRPLNSSIDIKFLEYLFRGGIDISKAITGAAQPQITRTNLAPLAFQHPDSEEEQLRIVTLLDEAFADIATAKANAEKNIQNARDLYRSFAFEIFASHAASWPNRTLNQISINLDNKRIPITKSDRPAGAYPYYGASGIVDYVAEYIFEGDTLLISEDGANLLARSTPIAFPASGRYWVNNHAHILKFENMATQQFVELYLESIPLDEYITGAAQPKLNQKALNSIPIPIPDLEIDQQKIVNQLITIQDQSEQLASIQEQKLTALDDLKKSLLHQAFSGQL